MTEFKLNSTASRFLSIAATIVLIAAVLLLYYSGNLFSSSPVVIVLQVGAALLMLWARFTFGLRSFHAAANPTPGALVTSGPYRFIRHPIYAAVWLFTWAGAFAHLALTSIALALLIAAAIAARIISEESQLRTHFPGYAQYAQRTTRLIPFIF